MKLEDVFCYYKNLKDNYYVKAPLTATKVRKMHQDGGLAVYIDKLQDAYKRIHTVNQKQALEILKVRFHNQNLIGALNEELTKEQKSNSGYSFSCCIGAGGYASWTSICRSITTVDSTIAGYVKDTYQVLEIDITEDGEAIFAVLEHKDFRAENAHILFWAHICNDELPRARMMARAMRPLWGGRMFQYYDHVYHRLGR